MMLIEVPTNTDPLMADEGYPVSGDKLRAMTFDPHPNQAFRMGDVLWPLLSSEERS